MVRAHIIRGLGYHFDTVADRRPHHFGNFRHAVVLEPRIENLAVDRGVFVLQALHVEIGHILDVDIRPPLGAAKHRDLAIVNRMIGQDVDRQVEPQPRPHDQ